MRSYSEWKCIALLQEMFNSRNIDIVSSSILPWLKVAKYEKMYPTENNSSIAYFYYSQTFMYATRCELNSGMHIL